MSKAIDSASMKALSIDKCKYCYLPFFPELHWYCEHPKIIESGRFTEPCTEEDWNGCPLNEDRRPDS